jgi:hypothetical protein
MKSRNLEGLRTFSTRLGVFDAIKEAVSPTG